MGAYAGRLLYWGDLVEFNGAEEGPEQRFLQGQRVRDTPGSHQRRSKAEVTKAGLKCHHSKHLQAFKQALNTLRAGCPGPWGVRPILMRDGRVTERVNKRLKELARPQQLRLLSRCWLLIRR